MSPAWHTEQYQEPKRSTLAVRDFAVRVLGDRAPEHALDAGCGAGANMAHLSEAFPGTRWLGIDIVDERIEAGRRLLAHDDRFTIECGDIFRLTETYGAKRFDATFSIMVLSWIEDYERALAQMLEVTRGWVIVLSLFAESELDAFIRVAGRHEGPHDGYEATYNVYSLARFEAFARAHGASEMVAEPFDIDIDLPRPEDTSGMGTWTERLESGRRLQFSGPLWMPWWLVGLRVQ